LTVRGRFILKEFNIMFENNIVGTVHTNITGLYTTFHCICRFPTKGMYRVVAVYGQRSHLLGLCIPENEAFVLHTKIPTKYLNDVTPTFYVISDAQRESVFITEDKFYGCDFLKYLLDAKLENRGARPGIRIRMTNSYYPVGQNHNK
jgi:hypothetical protein